MHGIASCSADGSSLLVRVEAAVPTVAFEATPLHALHVVSTPLSDVLRTSSLRGRLRTGFLTMDQTRRLILLSESDPKAFDSPLVGVWVAGVSAAVTPYAWAACARFCRLAADVAEVVTSSDGMSLLSYYGMPSLSTDVVRVTFKV